MTQNSARSARTGGLIIRLRHFLRSQNPPWSAPKLHAILNQDYLHPSEAVSLGTIAKFCYGQGTLQDVNRPNGRMNSELYAALHELLGDYENQKPTKTTKSKK